MNGITVYDDFAHHPTAIAATLAALRARVGTEAHSRGAGTALEHHEARRAPRHACAAARRADRVYLYRPSDLGWDLDAVVRELNGRGQAHDSVEGIVNARSPPRRAPAIMC